MSDFPTQLLINGQWHDGSSAKRLAIVNPATEETFAEVSSATTDEIGQGVEAAQAAFESGWRDMPPGQRAELLHGLAKRIRDNVEAIAQLETRNVGKPIGDARWEADAGAKVFEYYAGAIGHLCGQTIPVARGGLNFTLRQPMGVIAAITPWNFPFLIACWKVAPALAAGNSVVLKPASLTPLTSLLLGQLAQEAGLPDGVLQVLPGAGSEAGNALTTHPLVRKISFTGSTEIGSKIMKLAADDIKRVSLELGGKSPNIVFADADWQRAAAESPMSVFANTGQDCCARSRMFIEQPIFNDFVNQFVAATESLKIGDPTNDETQLGPMVSAAQREISESFVTEARDAGRDIRTGGERQGEHGFYLNPAVITDVKTGDRAWCEEIFGPVVCLRPFTDEAKMLQEVNDTSFGLSGSIWSRDLSRALRVARRVESGVISINTHSSVHTEAPFGGFKRSGLGRDLGMSAMEACTEVKNIYVGE
ncbi:MAG TPA: aldehyde dehydrogenase family protein [Verrucomicrobiota bacterium]|nr:aldehyde dehydrogenase family protein [Verrucomicrobiota bacterium]MDP6914987.1 aldehyde dehydrogenase family protein [Verrucomicrobiota bacterium]HJO52905.1 aldehyde dehydrogenase family protein [Verrucomicrobiota bacterium]